MAYGKIKREIEMEGTYMLAKDAVAGMVSRSGKSAAAISREMGMTVNFISTTTSRGSIPRLDTFARIAAVCGYEVILRGHGEKITIEYQ